MGEKLKNAWWLRIMRKEKFMNICSYLLQDKFWAVIFPSLLVNILTVSRYQYINKRKQRRKKEMGNKVGNYMREKYCTQCTISTSSR